MCFCAAVVCFVLLGCVLCCCGVFVLLGCVLCCCDVFLCCCGVFCVVGVDSVQGQGDSAVHHQPPDASPWLPPPHYSLHYLPGEPWVGRTDRANGL